MLNRNSNWVQESLWKEESKDPVSCINCCKDLNKEGRFNCRNISTLNQIQIVAEEYGLKKPYTELDLIKFIESRFKLLDVFMEFS